MGSMPNWFAKTKEMAAFDRYFSLLDVDEKGLLERYGQALRTLDARADYYNDSEALQHEWRAKPNLRQEMAGSLDAHFRGDWIHLNFGRNPKAAEQGGRFWPQVPSSRVVELVRLGTTMAIHKAMGDTELANLGLSADYRYRLWKAERENDINFDDGVRGIALSWNCVAPAGENFFEVEALRGPSVVEFAIATPRPFGHGSVMGIAEDAEAGLVALGPSTGPES
jgi:hypothetical protein